ncbi:hypothetical protein KGF57_002509 [Candida theae]|uniref:BTB domain-containing protein n=1 Tax=Candida theae TaxID=1198502 RepID=A0AAD5BFF7_9ASCO|nr:uncharacterized protein KGF57_002509 [Candida theae]KAI5958664.1 hypothetical protein KGF57_002509 [Candida theae]
MVDSQPNTKSVIFPSSNASQEASVKLHCARGSIPSHNLKSTIVACSGTPFVFLYGGFDENDALDSNVYLLNTDTMEWECDNKMDGLYREGHSAVYLNDGNILVYGGLPFDDETSLPSAHSEASASRDMRKDHLMMIYNIFDKKWIGPPDFALTNAPSSRSRHACCLTPDGTKLFISGGLVKSTVLSDLYCYDLTSGTWTGPFEFEPRFDHTIIYHNDRIYCFGGLNGDMNHVKTVTFYSFKTKAKCEASISSLATTSFSSLSYDLFILENKRNPGVSLFVNLPTWNVEGGVNVASLDLKDFEAQVLFEQLDFSKFVGENERDAKFLWSCAFINHNGSLFLLGNKRKQCSHLFGGNLAPTGLENEAETTHGNEWIDEEQDSVLQSVKLNHVLEVELASFGVSNQSRYTVSSDFEKLFESHLFADFEITSLVDEDDKRNFENQIAYNTKSMPVHKAILSARWPHFYRMISSGMNETLENRVFIPEPFCRVNAMVYYLYVGKIKHDEHLAIYDYSALVVLANMYELSDFKSLVLSKLVSLFEQFRVWFEDKEDSISDLLRIWKDLSISNERLLLSKIIVFVKEKWGVITRSKSFMLLSKDDIVKLCQDSTDETTTQENNTQAGKSPSRLSLHSTETISPGTPGRRTNSPFVLDSPAAQHNIQYTGSIF